MSRNNDVLARGMNGLGATGNEWVLPVAARAWKVLKKALKNDQMQLQHQTQRCKETSIL